VNLLAPGRNIVLIGLMGAGKTTIGQRVAERLARPFVDTDTVVEAEAGATVAEIFAKEGERGFRRREAAAIRHVAALRGQVVAVGGGAVMDPETVTHLRGTGDLVLLDAPAAALAERVGDTASRPLLDATTPLADQLEALRTARDTAYAAAASVVIDTDGASLDEVVDDVLAWAWQTPGLLTSDERP